MVYAGLHVNTDILGAPPSGSLHDTHDAQPSVGDCPFSNLRVPYFFRVPLPLHFPCLLLFFGAPLAHALIWLSCLASSPLHTCRFAIPHYNVMLLQVSMNIHAVLQ